jgi:hypothetical protein
MSGGALLQQKCNFYFLSWDFTKSGIPNEKKLLLNTYLYKELDGTSLGWKNHIELWATVAHQSNQNSTKQWQEVEKGRSMLRSN